MAPITAAAASATTSGRPSPARVIPRAVQNTAAPDSVTPRARNASQ